MFNCFCLVPLFFCRIWCCSILFSTAFVLFTYFSYLVCLSVSLSTLFATSFSYLVFFSLARWADVGEDKHTKVSLAFLRRKKRLGMMVKLLTKLISSSSKVLCPFSGSLCVARVLYCTPGARHIFGVDKFWRVNKRSFMNLQALIDSS